MQHVGRVASRKKNLLLSFDAFGTLYTPRRSIAAQYAEVARQNGLTNFTEKELGKSFKEAFKIISAVYPNYGREKKGMSVTRWWEELIVNTFLPYADYPTIKNVVPDLLERFSTKEGYRLYPDVERFFLALKQRRRAEVSPRLAYDVKVLQKIHADESYQLSMLKWLNQWDTIVVGVISNSDNRVANVLDSFNLNVGPTRYGPEATVPKDDLHDIDFVFTSYDAWREKPHPAMFHAADRMLASSGMDPADFDKLHVGDDYAKDVLGARDAGWNSTLLHREEETTLQSRINELWQFPTDRGKVYRISTLYGLSHWDPAKPRVQTGYYSRWAGRRQKGEFHWESRI